MGCASMKTQRITDCAELYISSAEHLVARWVVLAHWPAFFIIIWTKPNLTMVSQSLQGLVQVCYPTPSFTPAPPDILGKAKTVPTAAFHSYWVSLLGAISPACVYLLASTTCSYFCANTAFSLKAGPPHPFSHPLRRLVFSAVLSETVFLSIEIYKSMKT